MFHWFFVMCVIYIGLLLLFVFFFSSRRRHTRCALVTGVQTCALPICSICTAPGFSSSARRKASRTRLGILSLLAIWWVYLVIGPIIRTTSRIWKRPCFDFLIGFCPVIIIIGMPPNCA